MARETKAPETEEERERRLRREAVDAEAKAHPEEGRAAIARRLAEERAAKEDGAAPAVRTDVRREG